jgi:hypothetical protein
LVAKGITYKKNGKLYLLKIKLFLTCHIAQRIAQTPHTDVGFLGLNNSIEPITKKI